MTTLEIKLKEASQLPTHDENGLTPHFYVEKKYAGLAKTLYSSDDSPANIFKLVNPYQPKAEKYYIKEIPTYSEDGNLKKRKYWKQVLMFHKAWARIDIEVKSVTYDIVGLKRETTNLPAGVIIANIKFSK